MILTSIVSPPGNYSVRIVASTGGQSIVPYYITTTESNGEHRATPFFFQSWYVRELSTVLSHPVGVSFPHVSHCVILTIPTSLHNHFMP